MFTSGPCQRRTIPSKACTSPASTRSTSARSSSALVAACISKSAPIESDSTCLLEPAQSRSIPIRPVPACSDLYDRSRPLPVAFSLKNLPLKDYATEFRLLLSYQSQGGNPRQGGKDVPRSRK